MNQESARSADVSKHRARAHGARGSHVELHQQAVAVFSYALALAVSTSAASVRRQLLTKRREAAPALPQTAGNGTRPSECGASADKPGSSRRAVSARSRFNGPQRRVSSVTVFAQGTYTSVRFGARCIRLRATRTASEKFWILHSRLFPCGICAEPGGRAGAPLTPESPLLGAIPELDSMAVVLL